MTEQNKPGAVACWGCEHKWPLGRFGCHYEPVEEGEYGRQVNCTNWMERRKEILQMTNKPVASEEPRPNEPLQELMREMRRLLIKCAFDGRRVIYGAIHYWFCRYCGGSGSYVESYNDQNIVEHQDYCPIGKILRATKEFKNER